ncbi:hypothetical protein [Cohnella sp.]|uniref:hypothetical protein n=1 Tax=Cohnella sp. TaxID=1883426 RepID=UPI003703CD79
MNRIVPKEPPIAHAAHRWVEETRTLHYDYAGRPLLSLIIPAGIVPYYRQFSNGNLQSNPFTQQVYLSLDKPATIKAVFRMSKEALNMRPHRAGKDQAILGQVGRPLLDSVNGLYDVLQDLLIDWHGAKWNWTGSSLKTDNEGGLQAELEVQGGLTPWIVNLRMQYYRTHLNFREHRPWEWRPKLQPISGWSSWEAFGQGVTAEDVERTTAFLDVHFKPYGLEYVQIDDGYQTEVIPPEEKGRLADAWLRTNERFPEGQEGIVGSIRERGFEAGIWTSAMVTSKAFAERHREAFEIGPDGELLYGQWIYYVLKGEEEALAKHVVPFYRGLGESGYRYFKTDQIRHYLFDGLHQLVNDGAMSNEEAAARLREYMRKAREAIGEQAYFLACWGVLTEAVGLVDACRIAGDSNPSWTAVCKQIVESARWFHTQRILYLNDPDYVCARTEEAWGRSLLSLVSLSGGLLMLSDNPELYDEGRVYTIQRCLPSLSTATGETGPLDVSYPLDLTLPSAETGIGAAAGDEQAERAYALLGLTADSREPHPTASLWGFHFDTPAGRWCVAGRFAVVPLQETELALEALALAPDVAYHAFDFWKQRYMGKVARAISMEELPLGHCQIIGLRRDAGRPQLVGSSRHVSMDAISVREECWETEKWRLKVAGVRGTTESYWLAVPDGFRYEGGSAVGGTITGIQAMEDGILKADIRFDEADVSIVFDFENQIS